MNVNISAANSGHLSVHTLTDNNWSTVVITSSENFKRM